MIKHVNAVSLIESLFHLVISVPSRCLGFTVGASYSRFWRGALGGNGDVGNIVRLASGIELGIIGRLGVAMSSVGWCDGVVTAVGASGDGGRRDGAWRATSGAGAGPAGVVGSMAGGDGNIGGIVSGVTRVVGASLIPRPISIGRGGSGEVHGVNFLRKRRLRSVMRPDPSTLTWYWSCCLTSTTVPVLPHLFGCCPVWFWMRT